MEVIESGPTTRRPMDLKSERSFGDRLLIFERAVDSLKKREEEHNSEDLKNIMDCLELVEVINEYKADLPEPIYRDLLRKASEYVKLEHYQTGEIIFKANENIGGLFVVARGCVELYEPKTNEELVEEINEVEERLFRIKNYNTSELLRELEDTKAALSEKKHVSTPKYQRSIPNKAARISNYFQSLYQLQVLKDGDHDREAHRFFDKDVNATLNYLEGGITKVKKTHSQTLGYCLLSNSEFKESEYYMSTAVASVPSQIILIEKEKFLKVFTHIKVKLEKKWKFFGDYLENKSAKIVKNFYKVFKERIYKKNQRIFQQGDPSNEIYAVAEGEVELFRPVENEKPHMANMLTELKRANKMNNDELVTAGRMFGEIDSSHQDTHECTAISKTENTLLYVSSLKDYLILKKQFKLILRKVREKFENAGDAVSHSNTSSRDDMSDFSFVSSHRFGFDEDFDRPSSKMSNFRGVGTPLLPPKNSSFRPKVDRNDSLNNSVNIVEDAQLDEFNQLLSGNSNSNSKPQKETTEGTLSKFATHAERIIDTALINYQRDLSSGSENHADLLQDEVEQEPRPIRVESVALVRHASFQRLMKQKVNLFEKKMKSKPELTGFKNTTPVNLRPWEKDLIKLTKRNQNKTAQGLRLGRANITPVNKLPSMDPKKMAMTIQDFKKSMNDVPTTRTQLSVSGSQYRKNGIRIDSRADDLDHDEALDNFVTPTQNSLGSGSKKYLTTDQLSLQNSFTPMHGVKSTDILIKQSSQSKFFMTDMKLNMAHLELDAPFSRKKVPLTISMNSVKTLDSVKTMKSIFKKPGFISPENLNIKEIIVAPDTIRGPESADQTPMGRTYVSTSHNMFRQRPSKLHMALHYVNKVGPKTPGNGTIQEPSVIEPDPFETPEHSPMKKTYTSTKHNMFRMKPTNRYAAMLYKNTGWDYS